MVNYSHGQSAKYFGHADYYANKGSGKTSKQLLDFINRNMHILSPSKQNQPGGGGIYDQMVNEARMEEMFKAREPVPVYQAPTYEAPVIPDPKTLTNDSSAVGGGAKGVKIKRSKAAKGNKNTRGTSSLARKQRNSAMKISNLNLT
tara:strand:+ start:377 stop:814 length:438 start_codon:yes stop_codon:yes gene_type:complete